MDDSAQLSEKMTVASGSICCDATESKVCESLSHRQCDSDNLSESFEDQSQEYSELSDESQNSMSAPEGEEEDSLPVWFGQSKTPPSGGSSRGSKGGKRRTLESRRISQKMIQRERRAVIKSDPDLLAAQREKERVRQMTIRKRDSLIMSLCVDSNMPLSEANLILMQQQRASGVPEGDIISIQIGRENFRTIGELKHKIESKRTVDRERTRSKRAMMDDNIKEDLKKSCRERMREKRALMKQYNPSAAAAHREREKIRKRIERRRNAMLLALPDERIADLKDSTAGDAEPLLPFPINPEFSTALKVLKEDLLRKRIEQKEKIRRKRAELRDNHPELAAAMREKERIRKKIERRRNNLLLNIAPEALVSATQSASGADPNASVATLPANTARGTSMSGTESPEPSHDGNTLPASPAFRDMVTDGSAPSRATETLPDVEERKPEISNLGFKDEIMQDNQTQDSEMLKPWKESERKNKQTETVKREVSSTSPNPSTSITFNYDEPHNLLSTSPAQNARFPWESKSNFERSPNMPKGIHIKQEPMDDFDCNFSNLSKTTSDHSMNSQISSVCVPPELKSNSDNTQNGAITSEQNFTKLRPDHCDWTEHQNSESLVKCEPASYGYPDDSFGDDRNIRLPLSDKAQDYSSLSSSVLRTSSCNVSKRKMFKPVKAEFTSITNEDSTNDSECGLQDEGRVYTPRGLADSEKARNHLDQGKSSVTNIPEFSSIEEERDWFQTQICCLQNRVSHEEPHSTSGSKDVQVHESSVVSPEQSATLAQHVSGSQLTNPELSPLAHKSQTGIGDHYSAIAELTLRSSLEQMNALAGPNLVQAKLHEMIYSAKLAREKANEQARRRREKLRNDPELRRKYEETKSRDLERKRQQRAKEAEIRTVYPGYNEERRIKDRERKRRKRTVSGQGGTIPNTSLDDGSSSSETVMESKEDSSQASPQLPSMGPMMSPYRLPYPTVNNVPWMIPNNRLNPFYPMRHMPGLMSSVPVHQDMDAGQPTDVKPHIHQNHGLTS